MADDLSQLVEKFYYDNPDILNAVFGEPEFTEETIKQFAEIVNPEETGPTRKVFTF